ncbi:MAG TPA: sulfite exporter TauE/SafE family protein [Burkholderiales bacterium]|nr:sulfite exporter TauE/SafE family protein [Burkholderiales bacterium]
MPSTEILIFAPLIVIVAYAIFGMSGFGSTLIAVPLLAHLFDLKFALPTVVLLDCVSAIGMGFRLRANVNKRDLLPLMPFLLIGLSTGVFMLVRLPSTSLLVLLGIFATLYGIMYMRGGPPRLRLPRWSAVPVGLFAGTTSASIGVGGPIYVMYLASRGSTPEQIRATTPVIFIFTTIARIALFAVAGIFTREVLTTAALLLPLSLLALWWGHRLHLNLAPATTVRVIGGLLALSGVSLLARAL